MKSFFITSFIFISLIFSRLYGLEVNGIVAFGDSLSCNGNACIYSENPAPICKLYPQGRFTDGDVWIEVFADHLGLPRPTASLTGGYNFAYGGATTGWNKSPNILHVGDQIEAFLKRVNRKADPKSLYVLWAGGNDIKNNIIPINLISNLERHITDLAKAGAKTFLIPNYRSATQLPLFAAGSTALGYGLEMLAGYFEYDYDSKGFQESFRWVVDNVTDLGITILNGQLKDMLQNLERTLGITIYHFDSYTLFNEMKKNYYRYGLSKNANLFIYDGFHPNELAHKIVGREAFEFIKYSKKKTGSRR